MGLPPKVCTLADMTCCQRRSRRSKGAISTSRLISSPISRDSCLVVQLFLYKLSGGLQQPSNTNTGLLFVTKANVDPYLSTQTRFEGSSDKQQVVTHG